ncbi:MAG: winged helix-turn-helix domain-containing protein [Silvibacterium sp.]|nr:winged helix-turn-helix domain-containing protein [Silvibacterium sp.]
MRQFGTFRLDLRNECVWSGDEQLTLTPRPFAVLRYLVENPQRLVTHDELLEALWPETYVQPQVLRTYVLELRKLLGDDPHDPQFIETVPKRGYRFLAPVNETAAGPSSGGLIGRDSELAGLHSQLDRCRIGERPTVFIIGDVGIGKTALIDAFTAELVHAARLRIARGQCLEGFAGKEAFYPVREALKSLSADDEKVRTLLASAAPGWFGKNGASSPSIGEISEALEALGQSDTLLVVFEDIHWADSSTLDLISALARRRNRAHLMLLCSFRPSEVDHQHPLRPLGETLRTGRRSEELHLGPLTKESVAAYLRRELAAEKLPPGLASLIHQNSTGNPLFMIAALDHLRTQRVIVARDGEVTLSVPLAEIELGVPDSLSGVIELQLDRLTDADRTLLEAGSIWGSIFPAWAAAAALDRSVDETEEAYAALVRRVRLLSIAGHDELRDGSHSTFYVFAHALYREVLYNRMPASRRAQSHLRVAERLRSMFAGQEASVAHEIAAHMAAGSRARSA